jgi:DNA-binding NarL/FixJ family response regulator
MSASHPIQVLVVDDHAMVRSGLAGFLLAFDDLALAGEATSGEEADSVYRWHHRSTVCARDVIRQGTLA